MPANAARTRCLSAWQYFQFLLHFPPQRRQFQINPGGFPALGYFRPEAPKSRKERELQRAFLFLTLIVPVDGSGKLRLRPLHSDLQPAARTDFFDEPLGEFQVAFLRDREFDFTHCCDTHILGAASETARSMAPENTISFRIRRTWFLKWEAIIGSYEARFLRPTARRKP